MAAVTSLLIGASLAVGAASAYSGYEARQDQKDSMEKAAEEQRKIKAEQAATNAQARAQEQRNQIREERVRRARIMQSSENTGTEFSSGEFGALGSLSTQLGVNIGSNLGKGQTADNISQYSQNATNFQMAAQQSAMDAQNADSLFALSGSIFQAAGGVKTATSAYNRITTPSSSAGWVSQG